MKNTVVTYTDYQGKQFPALVQSVNPTSDQHATLVLADGRVLSDVPHASIAPQHDGEPRKCWEPFKSMVAVDQMLSEKVKEVDQVLSDHVDQMGVQLAGCGVAARGGVKDVAKPGDYGWSPAYQDVLDLRRKYEDLLEKYEASTEGKDEQLQHLADENAVTSELPAPDPSETRPEQPSDVEDPKAE